MKRLLLLLTWAVCLAGYSQTELYNGTDYLITTKGDTIRGKMKYMSGTDIKNKITCKVNDTLKYNLKAVDITYLKDGESQFISFQPPNEEAHYLLKIWSMGKYLELYEWQIPMDLSGGKDILYIPYVRRAGAQEFIALNHNDWKKVLPKVIADFAELADDVAKGRFEMDQLKEVAIKYNDWKEKHK